MEQSNPPVQAPFTAACYGAGTFIIDKTGTRFQVWTGRLTNPGPWGPHIFRTVQGGKPELVWFKENANGDQLIVMNKQLWFSYTPAKSGQWGQIIDGSFWWRCLFVRILIETLGWSSQPHCG